METGGKVVLGRGERGQGYLPGGVDGAVSERLFAMGSRGGLGRAGSMVGARS